MMLKLRRAIVLEADPSATGEQDLVVELLDPAKNGEGRGDGDGRGNSEGAVGADGNGRLRDGAPRAAIADIALVGRAEAGDEVIVNVQALDLGLGSGGFDVVHVNLTRGLAGEGVRGAHVMKLNYTSLQHAVEPVEDERLTLPVERPVAVLALT